MGLLSAATFGTSGSFADSLIAAGWTPGAAVTARVVIAALVLTVPALLQMRSGHADWASVRTIGLYGAIAVAGAQLCYFNALAHLSVGVALLLEYSGILLVVVWGWMRHGHRPEAHSGGWRCRHRRARTRSRPRRRTPSRRCGGALGLGAAVGLAAYFILSAETDESVPPLVMAWGGLVVGGSVLALASLSGLLSLHATFTAVTLLGRQVSWIIPVVGLALIAAVVAYVAGIAAVRLLGSRLASFVGLAEVLFAVVFAWLLLEQRLDATQLAGAALVVAGIALVRLDEIRHPTRADAGETVAGAQAVACDVVATGV